MIKLTKPSGPVWINPDHIVMIFEESYPDGSRPHAHVYLSTLDPAGHDPLRVNESPEEVIALIGQSDPLFAALQMPVKVPGKD